MANVIRTDQHVKGRCFAVKITIVAVGSRAQSRRLPVAQGPGIVVFQQVRSGLRMVSGSRA
jgi:hypothetical protein